MMSNEEVKNDHIILDEDAFQKRDFLRAKLLQPRKQVEFKKTSDSLWQLHPNKLLKYKPVNLHYYGWIPILNFRNISATVFSEIYLYIQTIILAGYTAAIHFTGFGAKEDDLRFFIKIFGTSYCGSLFNFAMLITFILGLFITLVINRWWEIRSTYSRFKGMTMDLIMTVSQNIETEDLKHKKKVFRAKLELTRYLNLGHMLLLMAADSQHRSFKRSYGIKAMTKKIHKFFSDKFKVFINNSTSKKNGSSFSSSDDNADDFWRKKGLKDVTINDLIQEGLVNDDEKRIILDNEKEGLPTFQTVYYWTQLMVHKCKFQGWIKNENTTYGSMITRLQTIVENASSIITNINSQLPYPYVHLVSFVVHFYLLVLATWFGCLMYAGYPEGEEFKSNIDTFFMGVLSKEGGAVSNKYWTVTWIYIFIMLANVTFQGLLDIHTRFNNPFGRHCTKFALKTNMYEILNLTKTMLTRTETMPAAFGDIFFEETESNATTTDASRIDNRHSLPSRLSVDGHVILEEKSGDIGASN